MPKGGYKLWTASFAAILLSIVNDVVGHMMPQASHTADWNTQRHEVIDVKVPIATEDMQMENSIFVAAQCFVFVCFTDAVVEDARW